MKKLMNLQLFTGSLTVTVYKDAGITTATASPNSTLSENDEVTLTITPATGKEIDEIECVSGGVTVNMTTKKFRMGESSVVLYVKSKSSKKYMVTENCYVCVNGSVTKLSRNMTLQVGKTGAITGVNCDGTELTINAGMQELIDAGVLIKM